MLANLLLQANLVILSQNFLKITHSISANLPKRNPGLIYLLRPGCGCTNGIVNGVSNFDQIQADSYPEFEKMNGAGYDQPHFFVDGLW